MVPNIVIKVVSGDVARWQIPLVVALTRWEITDGARVQMFLAQCAHESQGFKKLTEDLRYQAGTLLRVFPRYFTATEATRMAYDERAIAERVYGGRMGNAIEGLGEGYRFRGRGILQITGHESYEKCGTALNLPLIDKPELLTEPGNAAMSAGWFWHTHGCNELADVGAFKDTTRRINGGLNGQDDRELWLAKVQAAAAEG